MYKTVYIPMSADLIHPGHMRIIDAGSRLGTVTIGLLTDGAIYSKKKRQTVMCYDDRKVVVEHIKGVNSVVAQTSADYVPNLLKLMPDFVVHGDDWSVAAKQQVTQTLKQWNGELIELPYGTGITSTKIRQRIRDAS